MREHVRGTWQLLDKIEPDAVEQNPDPARRFPVTVSLLAYKSPAEAE